MRDTTISTDHVTLSVVSLICSLVHRVPQDFVPQLVSAIRGHDCAENLREMIACDLEARGKLIATLNMILMQDGPSNVAVVDKIFSSPQVSTVFQQLLESSCSRVLSASCMLLGHATRVRASFIGKLNNLEDLLSELINLETNPNNDVQSAAKYASSQIMKNKIYKRKMQENDCML